MCQVFRSQLVIRSDSFFSYCEPRLLVSWSVIVCFPDLPVPYIFGTFGEPWQTNISGNYRPFSLVKQISGELRR